jgi:hypothetical protein
MVFYEHLLDEIASGFTLFYYHGTTHGLVNGSPALQAGPPTSISQEFNYARYGFNLSKVFPVGDLGFFELQGGYVRSHDNNPAPVTLSSVNGNAFYVESQQYLTGHEITFYERYSWIDFDAALKNSTRQDYTIGFVKPLQTWFRFSAEYTYTDNRFAGLTGHVGLLEFQINY